MKQVALLIIASLCAFIGIDAQVIQKGDKFFDGEFLYVAETGQKGDIYLKGMDITGHQQDLTLRKGSAKGEYILTQSRKDEEPPFGCLFGCKVEYVRQQGMNFLGFYVEEHCMGQTLVLTPDNIVNCTGQQRFAEEADPKEQVSNWLMNQKYLRGMHAEVLRDMVEKLKAKKKKTIIERTNQDLIAYALAMELYAKDIEPVEADEEELEGEQIPEFAVNNAFDFITALGSHRIISIEAETTINLSDVLDDEELFTVYGRLWRPDYYAERDGSKEFIVSCERFDGRQLELVNIENLTIRGGKNSKIVVRPRYANVFNLYRCSNIIFDNVIIGHTEEGYCEGGVIYAEGSEFVIVTNCDLYGCGTYGLEARKSHGIHMTNTVIHDCSYGIMTLSQCSYSQFRDCDFVRCREFGLLDIDDGCQETEFHGCRFAQNQGSLFAIRSSVSFENCEIHHPEDQPTGNADDPKLVFVGHGNKWYRDNKPLKPRVATPREDLK